MATGERRRPGPRARLHRHVHRHFCDPWGDDNLRLFTRRRTAALATAVVLAAAGTLATASGALADDAGPWPGTEGRILSDGGGVIDAATGTTGRIPTVGSYATWAPDGSRVLSVSGQIYSVLANGTK